jgi:class I fructose-bisphosphate aldolase/fructose-bisphosphate aldolase/2-amino-3,7-dideoxy-D-threo-hept-6-ulosonate synthase
MNTRRLGHIFRPSGRTLIVATEHAAILGPIRGLERPGETIRKVVAGGADAVMTSFGIAKQFARELAPVGLILRADGAPTKLGPDVAAPVWFGVESALRLGADALCISAFPGHHTERESLDNLASVAREAHAWGLALQAEMVPGGMGGGPEMRTLENVALAARLGAELGADWVKVPYVPGFQHVTERCFKPVVILGGSRRDSVTQVLEEVKAAVTAGAAGITMGRNIFGADDPQAMTAALAAIIHDDATVKEALDILHRT